jgi:5-formyltetrahydrofolate cyclo-ligase
VMESNEPVDLFLLPGLAFDKKGGRLGRGGGYYDLFLQNYLLLAKDKGWKQPLLVALAYSVQIQEDLVPMTSTDVNIDALVSCDGIHPFSSQMSNTSSS